MLRSIFPGTRNSNLLRKRLSNHFQHQNKISTTSFTNETSNTASWNNQWDNIVNGITYDDDFNESADQLRGIVKTG